MMKPDSDYTPHSIFHNGLLLGVWVTKHGAERVARNLYPNGGYVIQKTNRDDLGLLNKLK